MPQSDLDQDQGRRAGCDAPQQQHRQANILQKHLHIILHKFEPVLYSSVKRRVSSRHVECPACIYRAKGAFNIEPPTIKTVRGAIQN